MESIAKRSVISVILTLVVFPAMLAGAYDTCIGDFYPIEGADGQVDLMDLEEAEKLLLEQGPPFVIAVEPGHLGDFNTDGQMDLNDMERLTSVVQSGGRSFVKPCFNVQPNPVWTFSDVVGFRVDGESSISIKPNSIITVSLYTDMPVGVITLENIVDTAAVTGVASNPSLNSGFDWRLFSIPGTLVNSDGILIRNVTGKVGLLAGGEPVTGNVFSFDYLVPSLPPGTTYTIEPGAGTNHVGGLIPRGLTLTIVSDRESVQFDTVASGGFEGVSTATLSVTLDNVKGGVTYTIQYAATGGTATAGADYNLEPGTLTFSPGQTTRTFDIEIISDGTPEPDETIVVTLSNPTGGALEIESNSQHTYTIYDDPPSVLFAADSSRGDETSPSAEIEVILAYPASEAVTVEYAATGGTATDRADYRLSAGTLTFAPGDMSKTISLTVIDDNLNEAGESVLISLSGASGATIGTPSEHAFYITDDEAGIPFDGLVWYHSEQPSMLDLDDEGNLRWAPGNYHQVIVQLPEQRLSQAGDVAEFTYLWKSDGNVIGCDCDYWDCVSKCFEVDITCLSGTSGDFRLGLFDSNGRGHINDEYMGNSADVFNGYLGYGWFIFPHVDTDLASSIEDCAGEVHKPGFIRKRTNAYVGEALLKTDGNWSDLDNINGFGLTPGQFSPLTLRLERTNSGTVRVSITLNGVTYTVTDNAPSNQPQKIDAFAMYFHHSTRSYSHAALGLPSSPRSFHPYPESGGDGVPIYVTLG